jgi:hypothetical protein
MWERKLWRAIPWWVRAALTPSLIALAVLVDTFTCLLSLCRLPAAYAVRGGWAMALSATWGLVVAAAAAAAATTASHDAPPSLSIHIILMPTVSSACITIFTSAGVLISAHLLLLKLVLDCVVSRVLIQPILASFILCVVGLLALQ